ncbi:3-oxoacyl-ACP reductase [Intrasporangium chromatireducens Q5-1]|uniref:3-oxoacyl-ACP reductase n=1 Tax=Intrasporangium chromatireducens Q5-1 TaxID=584657 RepID=W9GQH1_9MICO|nr:SDR family oxidoreductase [Intrasporangium chromatireducens]EWT07327.1 3-oxoacyl-ACP reductase [Intrasporangium chromatireducens Q5-1]
MEARSSEVAVVTGATGGLGGAIALELGRHGVSVVASGRDATTGRELVGAISAAGGAAIFVPADLENRADADRLARTAIEHFGGIDIVVASAGLPPSAQGFFGTIDLADAGLQISRTIQLKLNPVQFCLPYMIERGAGSILLVTSEGGRYATPGQTTVALPSAGLIHASRVLAKELSRHQIRVNSLCVIVGDTPTWDRFSDGDMTEQRQRMFRKITARAPFGIAHASDVGAVAAFLVSDDAHFITGATISATGD